MYRFAKPNKFFLHDVIMSKLICVKNLKKKKSIIYQKSFNK